MITLKNAAGTKAVNITVQATGMVSAMYVDIYGDEQQVLQSKDYKTVKAAVIWAKKLGCINIF